MGAYAVTVSGAAPIISGTQDLTVSGIGTPTAAILYTSYSTGGAANNLAFSIGFTDGSTHRVSSIVSRHNQATSETYKRGATDEVCMVIAPNGGGINGEAAFSSWITDGIRINWTNPPNTGKLVHAILFYGSDVEVAIGEYTGHATSGSTTTVSGLAFQPELLFIVGQDAAWDDTSRSHAQLSCGWCDADLNQGCQYLVDVSGLGTTQTGGILSAQYAGQLGGNTAGVASEITSITSDGFVATTRVLNGAKQWAYLALTTNGQCEWFVDVKDSPTSTGTQAYTMNSVSPQFIIVRPSMHASADSYNVAGNGGVIGWGGADPVRQGCLSGATLDGAGTSDTQSRTSGTTVAALDDESGTAKIYATRSSLDTDGFTLNFTTVDSSARKMLCLAMGANKLVEVIDDGDIGPDEAQILHEDMRIFVAEEIDVLEQIQTSLTMREIVGEEVDVLEVVQFSLLMREFVAETVEIPEEVLFKLRMREVVDETLGVLEVVAAVLGLKEPVDEVVGVQEDVVLVLGENQPGFCGPADDIVAGTDEAGIVAGWEGAGTAVAGHDEPGFEAPQEPALTPTVREEVPGPAPEALEIGGIVAGSEVVDLVSGTEVSGEAVSGVDTGSVEVERGTEDATLPGGE